MNKVTYRLNTKQKITIAENLINTLTCDELLSQEAGTFIANWVMTGSEEKTQSYFDVWDYVLKGYMPSTRPVLYRSCSRRTDGKIASFTASVYCAHKFSEGCSFLLICDTKYPLDVSIPQQKGKYEHTFYPLSELMQKEATNPISSLSRSFLDRYSKEDEHIMRVNLNWMHSLKWYKRGE